MLDQGKVMKEDVLEGLMAVRIRPWSWLISSGLFGFVTVDDQFGMVLFYSGAARACFFLADAWLALFAFSFFFRFCMRNCNCCLQISVGCFSPWGVCGKQIHCCCIFITDIICVEKWKDVCVHGEKLEITWTPFEAATMSCTPVFPACVLFLSSGQKSWNSWLSCSPDFWT